MTPDVKLIFSIASILIVSTLCGCASYFGAVMQTANSALKSKPGDDGSRLNPIYRYLRITIDGRTLFVTLGDIDKHPDGPIEIYYSAGHEVIRLQNGHIVGAIGALTEWRNVSISEAPSWHHSRANQPVTWRRTRDVMPGYRYSVSDNLVRSMVTAPQKSAFQDINTETLVWFEDRHTLSTSDNNHWFPIFKAQSAMLPPARYAVAFTNSNETVVYGEQCLSLDLCLTWQRWTPKKP